LPCLVLALETKYLELLVLIGSHEPEIKDDFSPLLALTRNKASHCPLAIRSGTKAFICSGSNSGRDKYQKSKTISVLVKRFTKCFPPKSYGANYELIYQKYITRAAKNITTFIDVRRQVARVVDGAENNLHALGAEANFFVRVPLVDERDEVVHLFL